MSHSTSLNVKERATMIDAALRQQNQPTKIVKPTLRKVARAPWRGVGTATTPLPSSTKELHTKIHSSASSLLLETSTSHSSHKQPRSTNDFSYQRPTVASTSHATLPVHRSVRVEESERPSMLRKRKDPPGTMNRAMASKRPSMATETETPWKRRGECVRVPPRPSHAMNSSAPEETSTSHRLSTLHGFTQREASSFSASHGAKDSALVQRRENTMTEQRKMACLYAKCIQYQYSVVRHQLSIKHQTPLPHKETWEEDQVIETTRLKLQETVVDSTSVSFKERSNDGFLRTMTSQLERLKRVYSQWETMLHAKDTSVTVDMIKCRENIKRITHTLMESVVNEMEDDHKQGTLDTEKTLLECQQILQGIVREQNDHPILSRIVSCSFN